MKPAPMAVSYPPPERPAGRGLPLRRRGPRCLCAVLLFLAAPAHGGVLLPGLDEGDANGDVWSIAATSAIRRALNAVPALPPLEQRLADARAAVARRPDDSAARSRLGSLLLYADRPVEALEHLWNAARQRPSGLDHVELFGFALLAAGDHANGARIYEEVRKRAPGSPRALVNLAAAYYHLDRNSEAVALLQELLLKKNDHLRGWYNLGVVHYAAGEHALAKQAIQRALQLQPTHKQSLAALCRLYRDVGEIELYNKTYRQLVGVVGAERADALLNQSPIPIFLIR